MDCSILVALGSLGRSRDHGFDLRKVSFQHFSRSIWISTERFDHFEETLELFPRSRDPVWRDFPDRLTPVAPGPQAKAPGVNHDDCMVKRRVSMRSTWKHSAIVFFEEETEVGRNFLHQTRQISIGSTLTAEGTVDHSVQPQQRLPNGA
jgi:hypothetical protein